MAQVLLKNGLLPRCILYKSRFSAVSVILKSRIKLFGHAYDTVKLLVGWRRLPRFPAKMTLCQARAPLSIGEVKHHVYVKGKVTRIVSSDQVSPFTCRLRFIISTHKLAVSHNFLPIRTVLSCFYQLIFYFEKFTTWIWRFPFAYTWRS